MLQGVAQVAGGVLLHVARHGAEHASHEGQSLGVAGVVWSGRPAAMACPTGGARFAGRRWQAHQGCEAARLVDGVFYVARLAPVLQAFGVDEAVAVPAAIVATRRCNRGSR